LNRSEHPEFSQGAFFSEVWMLAYCRV
jgi:hypothetical protein